MKNIYPMAAAGRYSVQKIGPPKNDVFDIPLGSIVEIQLTGYASGPRDRFYHPIHIHGNSFFILAQGHGTYGPDSAPGGNRTIDHSAQSLK